MHGFADGDIDRVINLVAENVRAEGKVVELFQGKRDLLTTCQTPLWGRLKIALEPPYSIRLHLGAPGGLWNYSFRADRDLGRKTDMTRANSEVEIYPLPLQHAIDFPIASIKQTVDPAALPKQIDEYPFYG